MSDDKTPGPEQEVWNRFGEYFESAGALGGRTWQRTFDMWAKVSGDLANGPMTTERLSANASHAMLAMQRNLEDIWASIVQPPQTQKYVQVLPTAFLFFDLDTKQGTHALIDAVHIPLPPEREEPPDTALIALSGTNTSDRPYGEKRAVADPAREGVRRLTARLRATLGTSRRFYLLEDALPREHPGKLIPGVYDGLVYLTKPPLPLSNIRIIVEPPPV